MPETSMGIYYPSSSDPPNGPAQMQALAAAVNTLLELPDEVTAFVGGAGIVTVTATSFATLPSPGPLSASITNPSSDYDLLIDVEAQSWGVASASNLQVGIAASGGMVFSANGFGSGGGVANGDNMIFGNAGAAKASIAFPVTIPAGAAAVTFTVQAMRAAATGTQTLNYCILRLRPRRFVVP